MYVGLSRAFLNDGTLRYKKKWGMKLRVFRKYTYALRMLRDTLPSRSFFQHNPFFCLSGGALYEAFFLHGKGMPDQVASTYRFEGISGLRYYDVRDFSLLKKE